MTFFSEFFLIFIIFVIGVVIGIIFIGAFLIVLNFLRIKLAQRKINKLANGSYKKANKKELKQIEIIKKEQELARINAENIERGYKQDGNKERIAYATTEAKNSYNNPFPDTQIKPSNAPELKETRENKGNYSFRGKDSPANPEERGANTTNELYNPADKRTGDVGEQRGLQERTDRGITANKKRVKLHKPTDL